MHLFSILGTYFGTSAKLNANGAEAATVQEENKKTNTNEYYFVDKKNQAVKKMVQRRARGGKNVETKSHRR